MTDRKNRGWSAALWAAQLLLAAAYGLFGSMKATRPLAELAPMMTWVNQFPEVFVRSLGVAEMLGAVGLILPGLLRIQPQMVRVTAFFILAHQACAVALHASRGEFAALPLNAILIALAALIAWGRKAKAPLLPR